MNLGVGLFPSLQRRGGCGINKKSRSHRSAADGWSLTSNVTRERPPRPRLFGTGPFFSARPPLLHKEGNKLAGIDSRRQTRIRTPDAARTGSGAPAVGFR